MTTAPKVCSCCSIPLEKKPRESITDFKIRIFCSQKCSNDFKYNQYHRESGINIEKLCSGTGEDREPHWVIMDAEHFNANRGTRDGYHHACKPCRKKINAKRDSTISSDRSGNPNPGILNEKSGFTYIWKQLNSGFYKIGFCKNWENRLKSIKTDNPTNPQMLHLVLSTQPHTLEMELHRHFKKAKLLDRQEWFRLSVKQYQEALQMMDDFSSLHVPAL